MMELTRRQFHKVASIFYMLLATGAATVWEAACNPADVWHQIETWVPVAIDAFTQVLALVDPLAIPALGPIAVLIKAGFADLAATVDDYINAPAADKATWAEKVKLILSELMKNFQDFVSQLSGSAAPIVKLALMLLKILLDAISGFIIKAVPSAAPTLRLRFEAGQHGAIVVTPTLMDRKAFVQNFNKVCDSNSRPDLRIPRTK